ncbi:MAG: glycosyltransferase family 4 protein [Candidatus Methylopumilus sp.]|nr:glycosyltransferase family 4 protein [Candidatus Methylopumilus sp.]
MRIAFDHQAFCLQKTGGISRYFFHLAEQLEIMGEGVGVFSPLYRNQYARQLQQKIVHGGYVKDYPPRCADAAVALNGVLARRQLRAWQPDVAHETYFSNTRSGSDKTPTVLTVFDMIGELGLDAKAQTPAQLKKSKKYAAVKHADHVICISEHTRQDLIRLYEVSPAKTSTIHLGCAVATPADTLALKIAKPYLLYVGLRAGYKNFARFIQGFASSAQLRSSFDIVAFGGGGFSAEERMQFEALKLQPGQVRQIDGDDLKLATYYRQASAFVYPSCYEGFGLPPLEAMANQCPVVSSRTSAMPEVIGDAAEFFDPLDLDSIATAIQNVVNSQTRTNELIAKGLARVEQFNWQTCAAQHLALYRSLNSPAANA